MSEFGTEPEFDKDRIVAALEALGEEVTRLRQHVHRIQDENRRLSHARTIAENTESLIPAYREVLARISWAEDLDEVRLLSSLALAEDFKTIREVGETIQQA